MSDRCTAKHAPQPAISPTHDDFRWVHGPGRQDSRAGFVELVRDISAGVHACLQIAYSSDLVREINQDEDLEQVSAPAVGKADAGALFRLSLVASGLLCQAADEQIALLNSAA